MNISIIGAGSWGTALAVVALNNGHKVKIYGRNSELISNINENHKNEKYLSGTVLPSNLLATDDIKYALKDADIVLFAVASQALRKVLESCLNEIPNKAIVINVAKGIENSTLLRLSQLISSFVHNEVVVLSGPSHAEEVANKLPTTLVSASKNIEAARIVQDVFSNDYLRVYTNDDVIGVEIGGALKNIIALAAGIIDGLGFGDNAKAALMTRGIKEIARLGRKLGAKDETFAGLSGIGDLIVTCTSMHSRNRRCGILLGKGVNVEEAKKQIGMVVEGIYATKAAYDISKKYDIEMPIVNELYKVLYEDANRLDAVNNLMARKKKHEMEEVV